MLHLKLFDIELVLLLLSPGLLLRIVIRVELMVKIVCSLTLMGVPT